MQRWSLVKALSCALEALEKPSSKYRTKDVRRECDKGDVDGEGWKKVRVAGDVLCAQSTFRAKISTFQRVPWPQLQRYW